VGLAALAPVNLRAKAIQWLAQREHSRAELRQKLLHWLARQADDSPSGQTPEDVDGLLDQLQTAGWLSAERFAQSRIHSRQGRYGNRRIEAELRLHGLRLTPAQAEELHQTELQRARQAVHRRLGSPDLRPGLDARQFQRLQRFLTARGFSAETTRLALREVQARAGPAGEEQDNNAPAND
jgi:regulatory protein